MQESEFLVSIYVVHTLPYLDDVVICNNPYHNRFRGNDGAGVQMLVM